MMNICKNLTITKTYNKLYKFPLGTVTANGWIKEQLLRNKDGLGGHLDEMEPEMIVDPFVNHGRFYQLPHHDTPDDPTFAAGWSSEISATYWTGLVELAFTLNDESLKKKAENWINKVLDNQEEDGYLGGYAKDTNRLVDYNPWSANFCYRALLSYYEATKREDILNAVHKGLLWFCDNWKDNISDYAGPTIIESLTIVYMYTGDKKLLNFAEAIIDWLNKYSNQKNTVQHLSSDDFFYASMHAVAYGEDVKHPAIVYCANGDESLKYASINGVNKAIKYMIQATGAPGSSDEVLSPPGASIETEYCNFITFNHTYSWMALTDGNASWGDHIERNLFNGAQGGRRKDEKSIAYNTAPNQLKAGRDSSRYGDVSDKGSYAPCFYVGCCPTKSVCNVPEFLRDMFMEDKDGNVYILCYGPANVEYENTKLTINTLYPFRQDINIDVTSFGNKTLFLRIPEWCPKATISINGETKELLAEENGFAPVKSIKSGDKIVIHFEMKIKVSKIDDSVSSHDFPICIERGPIVYALPVPEKWNTYPGLRINPKTDTWPWYEAHPDFDNLGEWAPWALRIDENIKPEDIKVTEHDVDGYVWETPLITLEVPFFRNDPGYGCWAFRNYEVWNTPIISDIPDIRSLVPHGCTNLRITYLPRVVGKKN